METGLLLIVSITLTVLTRLQLGLLLLENNFVANAANTFQFHLNNISILEPKRRVAAHPDSLRAFPQS